MLQVRPSPPRNHVLRDVRLQVKKLEDPLPRASAPHSRWLRLATHGFHRLIDVLIQTREGPTEPQESFRTPLLLQELGSRTYPKLGNKYNTESLIYIIQVAQVFSLVMLTWRTSSCSEATLPISWKARYRLQSMEKVMMVPTLNSCPYRGLLALKLGVCFVACQAYWHQSLKGKHGLRSHQLKAPTNIKPCRLSQPLPKTLRAKLPP